MQKIYYVAEFVTILIGYGGAVLFANLIGLEYREIFIPLTFIGAILMLLANKIFKLYRFVPIWLWKLTSEGIKAIRLAKEGKKVAILGIKNYGLIRMDVVGEFDGVTFSPKDKESYEDIEWDTLVIFSQDSEGKIVVEKAGIS